MLFGHPRSPLLIHSHSDFVVDLLLCEHYILWYGRSWMATNKKVFQQDEKKKARMI
jgi:hypothetical protein